MAKKRTASVSTYAVNLSGRARIYQRANHGEVIVVPDPDTMTVLYYRRGSWEQFHEVTVTWNPNLAVYFWRCQTMEGSGSFGYNPSGGWFEFNDYRFTRSHQDLGTSIDVVTVPQS